MKLNEFLVKAKIATYATQGEANERILNDTCKELIFEDGELKYRDRYYGFNSFVGEEIVWKGDKIIWSMNYYGKIHKTEIKPKKIYEFLKKAMRQISKERPFRGPNNFKEGDFEYIDESKGDVDFFKGTEKIFYKGEEVHILEYHGGLIKPKLSI